MAHVTDEEATGLVSRYYRDYAKYVLETRALPSIYDGLKLSQRRLVHVASGEGRGMQKSSKILGDTIPYHPHGLDSLYQTLVKLTTSLNRYPLFEGKGNWGGVGFDAAAYRYTETRLNDVARYLYTQFSEDADFAEGESGLDEPTYLPALVPYSLLAGSKGVGVGLSTLVMPFDAMELIDYFEALVRGDRPKVPTPDLGNYVLDMDDAAIDGAVEGSAGTLTVKSVVAVESDTTVVLDDLYDTSIYTLVGRLSDWIDSGVVDFRDETVSRPRYVFEIVGQGVTAEQLADRLTKLSRVRRTFKRLVVDGNRAVYCTLRDHAEASLAYLNRVLDARFERELGRLRFTEGVLTAIESVKSSGLLERLPKMTVERFKSELGSMGYDRDVVDAAASKPLTYLTKSHADELRDVRRSIRELRATDRTEYLLGLYEGLRELLRPVYDSVPHTVRRSRLLSKPKFSLVDKRILRVSNRGKAFDSAVYVVRADGTGDVVHVGTRVARDIPLEVDPDNPIVALLPDTKEVAVLVTKGGRAFATDFSRFRGTPLLRLGDGERVVAAYAADREGEAIPFTHRRKRYDAARNYRTRIAQPSPLGRPLNS